MQATTSTNRGFGINRLKVALIATGLLVATMAGVAAWQLSQDSNTTSASATADRTVIHYPTDRPFRGTVSATTFAAPITQDFYDPEIRNAELIPSSAKTMQPFYAAKEARQDALDLQTSTLADHTTQHEAMRRYFTHKEAQIDTLP